MTTIDGILNLYIWIVLCGLVVFLYRIARFFQITSRHRSYYQLFVVPIALLLGGGLRYVSLGIFVGDALGDVLMVLGGVSLIGLGYYVLRLMTGGRA